MMKALISRHATIVVMCILMLYINKGRAAQITTSPSQITIGGLTPSQQLRIDCNPSGFSITELLSLQIGKKLFGTNSPIISISGSNNVIVRDPSLQSRMTYSGSISGNSGTIQMILRNLTCSDAANTYYCTSAYDSSSGIKNDEDTANVTVSRVYPGNIVMQATPNSQIYANPPVAVTFECSGYIGNQFDQNMANFWVWEYRFDDEYNSQWTRYTTSADLDYQDPPTEVPSVCQYSGRSTLRYTVVATDNRKEFRCYVVSPEYGGNKTIYTQVPGQIGGGDSIMAASRNGFITVIMTFVTWAMLLMS